MQKAKLSVIPSVRKKLARANSNFHSRGAHKIGSVGVLSERAVIARRKLYLKKLRRIPFFDYLQKREETVSVEANGKRMSFTVFKNGFTLGPSKVKMLVVLDSEMRGMLMFQQPQGRDVKWLAVSVVKSMKEKLSFPMNETLYAGPTKGKLTGFRIITPFESVQELYWGLSEKIEKMEKDLKFKKHLSEPAAMKIRELL